MGVDQTSPDYTQRLQHLMQQVGLSSYKALSQRSGVSRRQLARLRQGQIKQTQVEPLLKLTQVLQVSLTDLLAIFTEQTEEFSSADRESVQLQAPATLALKLEYQRLEKQLEQQRQVLWQEFQQATLQTLESLLLQWPTAAYAAQKNPQAPAVQLLPLLRPVEQLLQKWDIETIGLVGVAVPYNPQIHQLLEGTTQPGSPVKIRYIGYHQGDKLLYRAKVSPVARTT